MIRAEPFKPEHIEHFRGNLTQQHIGCFVDDPGTLATMQEHGGWTAFDGDRAIGCGGVVTMWPGRHQAWALIAHDAGPAGMLAMTRGAARLFAMLDGRIEAYVEADFGAAHRWVVLLGFELETPRPMRHWFPDGSAAFLYSRVKK